MRQGLKQIRVVCVKARKQETVQQFLDWWGLAFVVGSWETEES